MQISKKTSITFGNLKTVFGSNVAVMASLAGFYLWALVPFIVPKPKVVVCGENLHDLFIHVPPQMTCERDALGRQWFRLSPVIKGENTIKLKPGAFPNGATFETFSDDGNQVFRLSKNLAPQPMIESYASVGGALKSMLQISGSAQDIAEGFGITPGQSPGAIVFRILPEISGAKPLTWSSAKNAGAPMIWWNVLNALAVFLLTTTVLRYNITKKYVYGAITLACAFFMALTYFEWAYSAMTGIVDPQDDSLYVGWVQRAINGNMFDCSYRVYVAFTKRNMICGGTPGAAILMLPLVTLKRLLWNHTLTGQLQVFDLQMIRFNVALYSYFTTLILFAALRKITLSTVSLFLAGFMLWGTSLVKWTFVRSVFTHGPEIFVASVLMYTLVKLFLQEKNRLLTIIVSGLIVGFLCLIRGEYIFSIPIFAAMVIVSRGAGRKLFDRRTACELSCFIFTVSPFLLLYRLVIARVGDYARGKGANIFSSFADLGNSEIWQRFFSAQLVLLDSLWTSGTVVFAAVFLGGYLFWKKSPHKAFYGWSLCFVLLYFFLTSLFPIPLGSEWQHRYLLKVYPLCLVILAFAYRNGTQKIRVFIWLNIIFSLFRQFQDAVWWNEDTYAGSRNYIETMRKFMTDSHLVYHGFDKSYYRSYAFFYLLFLAGGFFLLIKQALTRKR